MTLTLEEEATNYHTLKHIMRVRDHLNTFITHFLERGREHDKSKLESPELEGFALATKELSGLTYGSPEYNASKLKLAKVLEHHYANNRHHPEHMRNGIRDMNLVDIIEMFCDWKASSERHNDGNLRKSIEINGSRFQMSADLIQIFNNTIELVE